MKPRPPAADPRRWRGVAADIERAATPRGRAGVGCYSVEGVRLHERTLRAGCRVARALVAESVLRDPSPRLSDVLAGIAASGGEWIAAPDDALDRLSGERSAGIVGLVPLPEPPTLRELLAGPGPRVLLAAIDVEDPGNVGALMRTALAAGACGLIAVGVSDPFHPKAVRTSMGAVAKLPVRRYDDAAGCLDDLGAEGVVRIGAISRAGSPLPGFSPARERPLALLMGSEAFGLDPAVLDRLEARVSIPQSGEVDSFSVNAAAAILLYALRVAPGNPKP